jgi:uncharacterized cupredoxin-like copper-binding protein
VLRRRLLAFTLVAAAGLATVLFVPSAFGTSTAKYSVTATDFKFRIVPARVKAGKNTFTVVNRGEATHDFKIGTKKTRILNPGQRQTITVTLKKGRRYVAICTVPGHVQLGMRTTVVAR